MTKSLAISLGLFGLIVEVTAVVLMATKRLPESVALPVIVAGMFLAFVPIFVIARNQRRK